MVLALNEMPKDWLDTNRYHHTNFSLSHLASTVKANNIKVVVIIPAKEVANTIAGVILETVRPLAKAGIVTSTVVIDANSKDKTGEIAAKHGATVWQRHTITPELGPSQGKGDALWRGLQITRGDIVAFLDGDTRDPNPAHLLGILGPLLLNENIHMVRGCFDRPFRTPNGDVHANEGGRVTELTARPLLNLHFPQLAVFSQPLAGEFAGRRSLLEKLRFPVGYGVEIGTLIDAWKLVGLNGLAEVDLGTRQSKFIMAGAKTGLFAENLALDDHKPLRDLAPMSLAIMNTLEKRRGNEVPGRIWLPWKGRYQEVSGVERPALKSYGVQTNGTNDRYKHVNGKDNRQLANISGVCNFRDIGGYQTSSGNQLRRNLIFRSGDLSGLTAEGRNKLQALCSSKVFDLRRWEEIRDRMVKDSVYERWLSSSNGPRRVITPILGKEDFAPEVLAQRLIGYSDESTKGAVKVYRSILLKSRDALEAILSSLSRTDSPSPMIINCTAGKDRTGVIVMVLMLLAGCTAKDVAKEFHLSEEGLGPKWQTDVMNRLMQTPPFIGKDLMTVQRAIGARKEVMMDLVDLLEKEWGGIELFLRCEMQIEEEVIMKSKEALTN